MVDVIYKQTMISLCEMIHEEGMSKDEALVALSEEFQNGFEGTDDEEDEFIAETEKAIEDFFKIDGIIND